MQISDIPQPTRAVRINPKFVISLTAFGPHETRVLARGADGRAEEYDIGANMTDLSDPDHYLWQGPWSNT